MKQFLNARLRLTLWYIAIVAIVSGAFSAIIYNGVVEDIANSFQMAEFRIQGPVGGTPLFVPRRTVLKILQEDFENAKRAVVWRLVKVNGIILFASGIAAYVLAGKTIQPIEEALEEQKRFTADAGHELKTPLTALRTELEVALRAKKLSTKEAKSLLKSNLEEVVSLQKLAENLMLLNRYSKNHNGLHFEDVNIKEAIEKAAKKLKPMADEKNIEINLDLANIDVRGDFQSLEELMTILLDNAIKYSHKNSEVKVINQISRKNVVVKVIDQGVGIAKNEQKHLFDRFWRADSSRNRTQAGGYGLGLAIAKEIVDRHKGEISVESKLAKGSTFKITLPS